MRLSLRSRPIRFIIDSYLINFFKISQILGGIYCINFTGRLKISIMTAKGSNKPISFIFDTKIEYYQKRESTSRILIISDTNRYFRYKINQRHWNSHFQNLGPCGPILLYFDLRWHILKPLFVQSFIPIRATPTFSEFLTLMRFVVPNKKRVTSWGV